MDQDKSFMLGSGPLKVGKEVDHLGSERSENHFRLSTSAIQDECTVLPHPAHRSALPSLDSFSPDNPLIITQDPRADFQVVGTDSRGHVPINVPVTLETDSFVGYLRNSIKGYPGTPEWEFKGSKALGKAIIQGRFKVPTPAKDVWMGQEFLAKPLLPASFQRLVFTSAAKMFSSTYRVMVEGEGETLGYLNPLLAVATTVNISRPGQQPDMLNAKEDMRLLDSSLTNKYGEPLTSLQRQRHFDKMGNLEHMVFDTVNVYTFVICQSIVDLPSYRMKLGALFNLDLCPVMNGQPLQMLCKNTQNGKPIMSLLVWHKNLNYGPGRKATRQASDSGSSASSSSFCYSHSRNSSQDTSSSTYSGSMFSGGSSSISGVETSSDSSTQCSEIDDAGQGGSAASCGDEGSSECSSDSDYLSCIGEEEDDFLQQQQGPQAGHQPHMTGNKQSALLQSAQSAPLPLDYYTVEPCDGLDMAPVCVTVIPSSVTGQELAGAGAGAGASRRSSASGAGSKGRKSKGKAAAAAVASAARRVAARFRRSCPGHAL